jgi:hypothetical protein
LGRDVLNEAAEVLDVGEGPVEHFWKNAEFLSHVDVLQAAVFIRFLRLRKVGDAADLLLDKGERDDKGRSEPKFHLIGGTSYELELFSYQPHGVSAPVPFRITVGDEVAARVVGESGFRVSSNYDRPRILLQTGRPTSGQVLTTPLVIQPERAVGPEIKLLLEISPAGRDRVAGIAAPLLALAPIAAAAVVSGAALKSVLAAIGVILAVVLQYFGIPVSALLSPTSGAFARASTPTPPSASNLPGGPGHD